MPPYESIHEYYLHQHRNIEHFLELCLDHADSASVHELRLSIKKLRAFNKLAQQLCLHDTDEHIYIKHRVRQLYKLAGQLRDTQVQLRLLAAYEERTDTSYPEYNQWLLRREKKRIKRFGRKPRHVVPHATAHITHQKIGKQLAQASDETIINSAVKVLDDSFSKARELACGALDERDLHRIRIHTKQARYILNIILHSYPEFVFGSISVDSMRRIEIATGRWHDTLVKVEMLNKYLARLKTGDQSVLVKYQDLKNAFRAEVDATYQHACLLVKKEMRVQRDCS